MDTKRLIRKLRRPLALVMVLLVLYYGHPSKLLFVFSTPLILLGIGIRCWAAGYIHKNEKLTDVGPYGYVRNPLYLGSFLMGFGFCFLSGQLFLVILCMVLFSVVYGNTVYGEERALLEKFNDAYLDYKKKVPAFFPQFSNLFRKNDKAGQFYSFSQAFQKNKEYNAILGALAIYLIMFYKL